MRDVTSKRLRLAIVLLATIFCFAEAQFAFGQQISPAERLNELRRLRDQLQLTGSLRDADVVVILNERAISEAAQQLVGLEFLLSNGGVLKLTSVETELKPGAAIVKIGIQAKSSTTVNLQLISRINSGELEKDSLRLPLRVTDVKLMNGGLSSLFLKTIFGEWLKPETWSDELPAIEIPAQFSETMRIPAGRFDVAGEMPMEISTPDYQVPLKFAVTSLLALNKRAVIALRVGQDAPAANLIQTSFAGANDNDPAALEDEIARLSEGLSASGDMRVRVNRRVINTLLAQMATAQNTDFNISLKRGRIRSEEVNVIVNVTNYTDVEGGEGRADITQLNIERIADGKIEIRLTGQGEMDARVNGREYGIPYTLSPHVSFSIKDQSLPLEFFSEEKKMFLRAAPGSTLPINVRFTLKVAGQDFSFSRQSVAQADKWLNRIELPSFFDREISLPRKMEIDAGGNPYITEKRSLGYTLSSVRAVAKDDAIEIIADVKLNPPK
ncbi:MAG: hypothetical protein AB7U82_18645 [Blastocatellales bacterium]